MTQAGETSRGLFGPTLMTTAQINLPLHASRRCDGEITLPVPDGPARCSWLSEVSSVVALAVTALRGPGWQEPILAWNPGLPAPNHWSLSSCLDALRT